MSKNKKFQQAIMVGLSLAAVLTTMPANTKAAETDLQAVCVNVSYNANCGLAVFDILTKQIDDLGGFSSVLFTDGNINVGDKTLTIVQAIDTYRDALKAYSLMDKENRKLVDEYLETVDLIKEMFNSIFDEHDGDWSLDDIASMNGLVKTVNDKDYTHKPTAIELRNAKNDYNKMTEYYDLDLNERLLEGFNEAFNNAYEKLSEFIDEYVDEEKDYAEFVSSFEKILEGDMDQKDIRLSANEAVITGYGTQAMTVKTVDLASKTALKARINKIKNAADYKIFQDETEVLDLIEAYEDLIDDVSSLSDLTKEKAYQTYTKTKTSDENATVKDFIFKELKIKSLLTDEASRNTLLKETELLRDNLDLEQYTVLKDLMEDVVDEAWNYEVKTLKNYSTDKSDWVKGITASQKSTLTKNIPAILYSMVDSETGNSGWDILEEHMGKFKTAWAAVTTDIENINRFNFKTSDAKLIAAAEDALFDLTEDGIFENNLTTKQKKELRRIESEIKSLKTAFMLSGISTQSGWINKGNGNWDYIAEDGARPSKWVASGPNWYYVKNGVMLRNSWIAQNSEGRIWYYVDNDGKMVKNTWINGYFIDNNGQWRK